ncbi:MAG TPA: LPS export ABC transporter periplasmic protein LptC [Myxococcota bacterium]|nr:LPS export ABC transporter periplasmic protein LptC [Myxococcota bacterium]
MRPVLLAALCAVCLPATAVADGESATLRLEGMTFVGSRDSAREMVVQADRANFQPSEQVAHLENVHSELTQHDGSVGFEMDCDRGELDTSTSNFYATGNVHGRTGDGRNFSTTWVRYDDKRGLAYTDAPVTVKEPGGTYKGGGFRYLVREQRFRFVGGASLVRE